MHTCEVYNLLRERNSYPFNHSFTIIPAQVGIHCGRPSTPPTTTDLPEYVSVDPSL